MLLSPLSPQATEYSLWSPPATEHPPVMVPSGHGANPDQRTLCHKHPQPWSTLAAVWDGVQGREQGHAPAGTAGPQGAPGAPQVPGEAGAEPGVPRATLNWPSRPGRPRGNPAGARGFSERGRAQGAGQAAGCPTAGHGFRAGLETGGSDNLLPTCQPRLGQ